MGVCGEGDDEDAFAAFQRELDRYKQGDKYEAAAAWSICAPREKVLDRLQVAAEMLAEGEAMRDQRTARHWSDRGMPKIAYDLAYLAMVRGRLGRDVISIELYGSQDGGVELLLEQIVSTELANRAPVVTVWQSPDAPDGGKRNLIDLDRVQEGVTPKNGLLMKSYRIKVALPEADPADDARILSVTIEARRAPTPTFFYGQAEPFGGIATKLAVYRSIAMIDFLRFP